MVKVNWRGARFKRSIDDEMERRMGRAVQFLRGETIKGLNRTQPTARSGRGLVGLAPSAPGEPPKRVTSRLFTSIAAVVERDARGIVGRYGTNVKVYPLALEFGTSRIKARPFLRPPFFNNKPVIRRILVG